MAANPNAMVTTDQGSVTPIQGVMPAEMDRPPRYPAAVGACAVLALLVSAWGGLAAFIGPSFGYKPTTGGGSLTWDLARAVLSVAPAIGGVVGSLMILGLSGHWMVRTGRRGLVLGAELVAISGAWFALGFVAWPALGEGSYLTAADAMHGFDNAVGVAIGPGVLLAALAAIVLGFVVGSNAMRRIDDAQVATTDRPFVGLGSHSRPVLMDSTPSTTASDPVVVREGSGPVVVPEPGEDD